MGALLSPVSVHCPFSSLGCSGSSAAPLALASDSSIIRCNSGVCFSKPSSAYNALRICDLCFAGQSKNVLVFTNVDILALFSAAVLSSGVNSIISVLSPSEPGQHHGSEYYRIDNFSDELRHILLILQTSPHRRIHFLVHSGLLH